MALQSFLSRDWLKEFMIFDDTEVASIASSSMSIVFGHGAIGILTDPGVTRWLEGVSSVMVSVIVGNLDDILACR